ncbi:MAG: alkaline phosphatase D family protein [Bacteroidota bacterium]
MKLFLLFPMAAFLLLACKSKDVTTAPRQLPEASPDTGSKVIIAFGSCNKHDKVNVFWDDILNTGPDIWIWGGDNIYADTEDIQKMAKMYTLQNEVEGYAALRNKVFVTGTWDDHDYGVNDGGVEFSAKRESQQAFLDFMQVDAQSPRRKQEGVYTSHTLHRADGVIKIIILDTRYFRSPLTPGAKTNHRYRPNVDGKGTILGDVQWAWLQEELEGSGVDFHLIVTSIQFLSNQHGFEKWANFPNEVKRMEQVVSSSRAKGVIFLSGDRHISEFSKAKIENVPYPILDFTSSGLTHSYTNFKSEPNPFRVGKVVSAPSFGVVEIDMQKKEVHLKIMGENGTIYQEIKQGY